MKSAIYLLSVGMNADSRLQIITHITIAFLMPLAINFIYISAKAPGSNADEDQAAQMLQQEQGYEDMLVFPRQFLLSGMLVWIYMSRLKQHKICFIKSSLHEMNEQSISDILDQVSEPIVIVKQKHRISLKPKYMNNAAKEIL